MRCLHIPVTDKTSFTGKDAAFHAYVESIYILNPMYFMSLTFQHNIKQTLSLLYDKSYQVNPNYTLLPFIRKFLIHVGIFLIFINLII